MAYRYLKSMTVPVPLDQGPVVIRKQKTVEYELGRKYSSKTRDSRVRRCVIGKIDPADKHRMFPNENYFRMFPNNPVPESIRYDFLRECAVKREMAKLKKDPIELAIRLEQGLQQLKKEGEMISMEENNHTEMNESNETGKADEANESNGWAIKNPRDFNIMKEMFDYTVSIIGELAMKYPNEVVDGYKVQLINEVLAEIRACYYDENLCQFLRLIDNPAEITAEEEKTTLKGLTYSDVYLMLKWYESMPV